jgi:hypothetical protein
LDDLSRVVLAEVIRDALAGRYGPLHYRGLRLQGLHVAEDLDLSYLAWNGELRLENCRIDGKLSLFHVRVAGQVNLAGSHVQSFDGVSAAITGSLLLWKGFRSERGVRLIGATVTNSLNFRGSYIAGSQDNPKLYAIEMFRAHVGDLFLIGAIVEGGVFANRMTVDQHIRLGGSTIRSRSVLGWADESEFAGAASFASTQVGGTIVVGRGQTTRYEGLLQLGGTSCAALRVRSDMLAHTEIRFGHFSYRRLLGVTPTELFDYLRQQDFFDPSSYTQLAGYSASVGEFELQRRILSAMERCATRRLSRRSAARIRRTAFEYLVGYGYAPLRSLYWLCGALTASVALLRVSAASFLVPHGGTTAAAGTVVVNHTPAWGACVELALDNLLPFAALGVQSGWSVAAHGLVGWLGLAGFLVLKFGAWGLVALGLGSITGLIRNPAS